MGLSIGLALVHAKALSVLGVMFVLAAGIFGEAAAQTPPDAESQTYDFAIPRQPILKSLTAFTDVTGIQTVMPGDGALTGTAPAVDGRMSAAGALSRILAGSEVGFRFTHDDTVTLERRAAHTNAPIVLDPIEVSGALTDNVISGTTSIGTLGARPVLDTPFSVTAFTDNLIKDTNARQITEVIDRDPSVSRESLGVSSGENFSIRGLVVDRFAILYDGIPGLAGSDGQIRTNNLARVEMFRGINAFNSGAATSVFGGIGGTVNLVPKRPADVPIKQVLVGFEEDSSPFFGVDFSRRFGQREQFGARFNGFFQHDAGNIDNYDREIGNASLFLDWKPSDRLTVEGEVSRNIDRAKGLRDDITVAPGLSIPDVPGDLEVNFGQPWTFNDQSSMRYFGRVTYDVLDNWTASVAYGETHGDPDNGYFVVFPSGGLIDLDGTVDFGTYRSPQDWVTRGGVAKLDGEFDLGPVENRVSFSATYANFDFVADDEGPSVLGLSGLLNNIYHPTPTPRPQEGLPADVFDVKIDQDVTTYGGLYEGSILDGRLTGMVGLRRVEIDLGSTFLAGPYNDSANTLLGAFSVKPTEDSTLYISYSEGLEAGLFAPLDAANANAPLPPSEATQIEVGGKYEFGGAIASAAVFQIDRPQNGFDNNNVYREVGSQIFRGLELRLEGEVTPGFRLIGGTTFLDVEIDSSDAAIDGKRSAGVPEFAAAAYAEVDIPFIQGLTLTGGFRYEGKQFIDNENLANREADGWFQLDLGARYNFEAEGVPLTVQIFVDNVLDEGYWDVNTFGGLQLSTPRTISVSLTANF